jgi:hypothetical protein
MNLRTVERTATASEDKASPFRTALAEWKRAHGEVCLCEAAVMEGNEKESARRCRRPLSF